MTEPKANKKTLKKLNLIFKWFSLALLSLLIILALIFQAPWKVTALLVIVLLACTILPKSYRKWFWLSAGAVVIALIIWVFLPDKNGDWQPYKFNLDEELAALEARYSIPPEENAAIIYDELLQDFNEETFYADLSEDERYSIPMCEPWLSKDHPELAEWLKGHDNTITKLLEASKIEKCMFRIIDPEDFNANMYRYPTIRHWAFLIASSANNDIAEGRTEEGLQKNLALLQMGTHMCQQSTTIDWLTGTGIQSTALSQFTQFVISDNPEETHLRAIEQALGNIKQNWSEVLSRILDDEILIAKQSLAPYYEINPKGKIRLSRDPLKEMRANIREYLKDFKKDEEIDDEKLKVPLKQLRNSLERTVNPSYFEKKLIKAKTILFWFYIPSSPQKAAKIIDSAYEKYRNIKESDIDWEYETRKSTITSTLSKYFRYMTRYWVIASRPLFPRIHELYLRHNSEIRGVKIIIALRRHKNKTGNWPESLDEIKTLAEPEIFIDPINKNSFVYKLTEKDFTLYSKGKNNIDEDGRYNTGWDSNSPEIKVREDDRLIWSPKRKIQEEKNNDE